ncbi:MAG: GNAT family N-acetyltransferase [Planctomycetota bacterium]
MIFETRRLLIRDLSDSDFEAFHEMQSDEVVMRYTTGKALDAEENQRQLETCIASYANPTNEFWVWAVQRKSDQQFVGTCAIVPSEDGPEIGYRFRQRYFGQGFGQEVCDGLVLHATQELGLTKLIAYVDRRNVASIKILDRSALQFVREVKNEDGILDRFYRWTAAQEDR